MQGWWLQALVSGHHMVARFCHARADLSRTCGGAVRHIEQSPSKQRMPVRVAVIDIGTNTAKLLVAQIDASGQMEAVVDEERRIRLGEAVNAPRAVVQDALRRLKAALMNFRCTAHRLGVNEVMTVGTSASRSWPDSADLQQWVYHHAKLEYRILSRKEEALWSHIGARIGMPQLRQACASIDIGGGSTELVLGADDGTPVDWNSMPLGSMRLTRKYFRNIPPVADDVERARRGIRQALEGCTVDPVGVPLVCASQTPRLLLGLEKRCGTCACVLRRSAVRRWRQRLIQMSKKQILALNPEQMEGRADVFPAAVLILEGVLSHYDLDQCLVSPMSLRHGLALYAAGATVFADD